jgi:hypothetical protein
MTPAEENSPLDEGPGTMTLYRGVILNKHGDLIRATALLMTTAEVRAALLRAIHEAWGPHETLELFEVARSMRHHVEIHHLPDALAQAIRRVLDVLDEDLAAGRWEGPAGARGGLLAEASATIEATFVPEP